MPKKWETVRVFISSTFRDMQAERDYLVRFVFPRLRETLLKRRIHLVEVDLRWGVTSDQDVLGVCREIIDECRPRFLCLLGGRYGWMPPGLEYSITAEEIQYAVLNKIGEHGYAYFYFRDAVALEGMDEIIVGEYREPVGSIAEQKLIDLKKAIVKAGFRPRNYPARWDARQQSLIGLEAFGDQVYTDLLKSIDEQFGTATPAPVSAFDREKAAMETFIAEQVDGYIAGSREPILQELTDFAFSSGSPNILLLTGASGAGKSALLAQFLERLSKSQTPEHETPIIISHFISISPASTSLRNTLRRLCHDLFTALGMHDDLPMDLYRLAAKFQALLTQAASKRHLICVIDGLNQFDSEEDARTLQWLPWTLPDKARFIFSTVIQGGEDSAVDGVPELKALKTRGSQVREIPLTLLAAADALEITRAFLTRYQKRMTREQQNALLKKKACRNPLYLIIVLEELRSFGVHEKIKQHISELPDDIQTLFQWILSVRHANDPAFRDSAGQAIGAHLIRHVASLLCVSRHGLSQQDLIAMIDPGDLQGNVAALLRLLRPYLILRGELIDFYHDQLRRAVENQYLTEESDRVAAHRTLAAYFLHQADPKEHGTWEDASARALAELPYHIFKARLEDRLFSIASDPVFLDVQAKSASDNPQLPLETIRYAIRAAVVREDAGLMAEFGLDHAQRLVALRGASPLDALSESDLRQAWNMADCAEPNRSALWYLLIAWKLKVSERVEEARETLKKVADKQTVLFTQRWMEEVAARLLAEVADIVDQPIYGAASKMIQAECSGLCRRLCNRGYSTIALQTARNVMDVSARDDALWVVALDYARKEDIAMALNIAAEIDRIWKRTVAKCDIANLQKDAGDIPGARQTLARIIADSETVEWPESRAEVHRLVARALSSVGPREDVREAFDKALSIAMDIKDDREKRDLAIKSIAGDQADSGDFGQAFATLANIYRPEIRVDALGAIVRAQARSGELESAQEIAMKLPYAYDRSRALASIATARALSGDISGANRTVAHITRQELRDEALKSIAAAQAANPAEAMKTIQKIGQSHVCKDAVCAVVTAQVKAGDIAQALCTADGIEDVEQRAHAFHAIAVAQTQVNDIDGARKIFIRAMTEVTQIQSGWGRDHILVNIATDQAKAGDFSRAIAAAGEIQDETDRTNALVVVAITQMDVNDYSGAWETLTQVLSAPKLSFPFSVAGALCNTAFAQLDTGNNKGVLSILDQAVIAAKEIQHTGRRDQILSQSAIAYARAGNFDQAIIVYENIEGAQKKVKVLCAIVDARSRRQGKDCEAWQTFVRALKIWVAEDSDRPGYEALIQPIAEVAVQAEEVMQGLLNNNYHPDKLDASDPFYEFYVEAAANDFDPYEKRDEVLCAVALAHARAARAAQGLMIADKIENEIKRAHAFCDIAAILIAAGDNTNARQTLLQATASVGEIHYGRLESVYKSVAIAMARMGDLAQAMAAAEKIKNTQKQVRALCDVARVRAEAGDIDGARKIFKQARITAVNLFKWENERDEIIEFVAISFAAAMARAGDLVLAMQAAEEITDTRRGAQALFALAEAQARTGNFAQALSVAKRIKDKYHRGYAFSALAAAQTRSGAVEQALEVSEQIQDDYERADVLCAIAMVHAQAGDLDQAMETVGRVHSAYQRKEVIRAIAEAHAKAGNIARAMNILGLIERAKERMDALYTIATTLAKEKKTDEVIQVLPHCFGSDKVDVEEMASAFDTSKDKRTLEKFFLLCAHSMKETFEICGVLAKRYPHHATAIAEAVLKANHG